MASIETPRNYMDEVKTVEQYLNLISKWYEEKNVIEGRFLSGVWFRGVGQVYANSLCPGVYRDDFSKRAENYPGQDDLEKKPLNLEREMLSEFRTSGATFLGNANRVDIYFIAQHFGMPTRLLDWTTNSLAGLFFAVENTNDHDKDGEVFVMAAKHILPSPPMGAKGDEALWEIVSMHHPYVTDAIGESSWQTPRKKRPRLIIPVRPDNQQGRIGRQSSCFTLHMHRSINQKNNTLAKLKIAKGDAKAAILNDLRRMNVNQFTIYNDLDHLSKDIKRAWGFRK